MERKLKKRWFLVSNKGVYTPFNKKSSALKNKKQAYEIYSLKTRLTRRTIEGLKKSQFGGHYTKE